MTSIYFFSFKNIFKIQTNKKNVLWNNYRKIYGDTEGKKLTIFNIHHDFEILNTFVYSKTKNFITADAVEFE